MNQWSGFISMWILIIFGIICGCGLFILSIIIIRWIFRIDTIISLLEKIAANHKCDGCNRYYRIDELKIIDSGQHLCANCLKKLESK